MRNRLSKIAVFSELQSMKKTLLIIAGLLLILAGLSFTPQLSHLRNYVVWGKHSVHDHRTHPVRNVEAADKPQPWPFDSLYNKSRVPDSLMTVIDSNDTHAFLVIRGGRILYEKYWDQYDSVRLSGSFSAAKSIISLLIGIALDEGRIRSLDDPAGDYVPHFKTNGLEKVTIRHLLTMSSGTNYNESDKGYFSMNASAYYGDDITYMVSRMERMEEPGVYWKYRSGDTQVLGLIVEKVFGKSISELVSERFMKPMGAGQDAQWLLDGDGKREKAFCCFSAAARDYARFGQLLLNKGKWGEKRIVSEAYLNQAVTPASHLKDRDEGDAPVDFYGYQYWIFRHQGLPVYAMNGLFGQYVYVIPDRDAVVVRLGESKVIKAKHHFQPENFTYIDAALSILSQADSSRAF
jgi:CubicO group peptidase (beta-lactamase class C family)